MRIVSLRSRLGVVSAMILQGCAMAAANTGEGDVNPECRQWRLEVANTSSERVRVSVSGEGGEEFLGVLGPRESRIWVLSTEPERVMVLDELRGAATGVEVRQRCLSASAGGAA